MTLNEFIKQNKEEIDNGIKRVCPDARLNNEERRLWVLNDEGLYRDTKSIQRGWVMDERTYAGYLLKTLGTLKPCIGTSCPLWLSPVFGEKEEVEMCSMCRDFVNVLDKGLCPCHFYGEQEAIKRAWLALEAKGYLEDAPC